MQAKLPVEKLWRFCRAGSVPTPGHETRPLAGPLADGSFLERFLLTKLSLFPSIPIWLISEGNVLEAKLSRGRQGADGTSIWEDVASAVPGGISDGEYKYIACDRETFLRVGNVDSYTALSAAATVRLAGTLEVKDGVLATWTITSRDVRPSADLAAEAKLPLEKLWRFYPAGSVPTLGHQIRPVGGRGFLEQVVLAIPENPGTAFHDDGSCTVCEDFVSEQCGHLICQYCHHPQHRQQADLEKMVHLLLTTRTNVRALTSGLNIV